MQTDHPSSEDANCADNQPQNQLFRGFQCSRKRLHVDEAQQLTHCVKRQGKCPGEVSLQSKLAGQTDHPSSEDANCANSRPQNQLYRGFQCSRKSSHAKPKKLLHCGDAQGKCPNGVSRQSETMGQCDHLSSEGTNHYFFQFFLFSVHPASMFSELNSSCPTHVQEQTFSCSHA